MNPPTNQTAHNPPTNPTAGNLTRWYLGSMLDGLFIIDAPPRPSTEDQWHDRPDGPSLALSVCALSIEQAQAIVNEHNSRIAVLEQQLAEAVSANKNLIARASADGQEVGKIRAELAEVTKYNTGLIEQLEVEGRANESLRFKLTTRTARDRGEIWIWQGDGCDHLESLTCPVQIQPKELSALTEGLTVAERERDIARQQASALANIVETLESARTNRRHWREECGKVRAQLKIGKADLSAATQRAEQLQRERDDLRIESEGLAMCCAQLTEDRDEAVAGLERCREELRETSRRIDAKIQGKSVTGYLHTQFPATIGHKPLSEYFGNLGSQLVNIACTISAPPSRALEERIEKVWKEVWTCGTAENMSEEEIHRAWLESDTYQALHPKAQ